MKTPTFEKCILCQRETGVSVDLPVDSRENYALGLGQLCEKCYADMQDCAVTDELMEMIDMNALLNRCRNHSETEIK